MKQIEINYFNQLELTAVMVGNKTCEFRVKAGKLIIEIEENYYYNNPFIVLQNHDLVQYIHQFEYFKHYQILITHIYTVYQL